MCGSRRSLQRCFAFDKILLHSGDIRGQVAKLPKFLYLWAANFFEGRGFLYFWPNFVNPGHLKNVAKFGDDRQSDVGDEAEKKKETKIRTTAAKHNGKVSPDSC